MTDNVTTTAKVAAVGISLPAIVELVPEPYSHWLMWACVAIATCGYCATLIDVPADPKSKWMPLYKALQFLAANYGKAANAALLLKHPK